MSFTWLDFILLAFMVLSGFLAMARGFTREVMTILSWALSAPVSFALFPYLQDYARSFVQTDWLADIILVGVLFTLSFLLFSLLFAQIALHFLNSRIGSVDRTFGLCFGSFRGFLIVAVAYLLFTDLVPEKGRPLWVQQAATRPFLDGATSLLSTILLQRSNPVSGILPKVMDEEMTEEKVTNDAQNFSRPQSSPPKQSSNAVYRGSERLSLEQLLESTSHQENGD